MGYYNPSTQVRLSAYADTIVFDHNEKGGVIYATRFGGYPEMVRAMAGTIYGSAAHFRVSRLCIASLQSRGDLRRLEVIS